MNDVSISKTPRHRFQIHVVLDVLAFWIPLSLSLFK